MREGMLEVFQDISAALAGASLLIHPCPNPPTSLTGNPLKQAVGTISQTAGARRLATPT